MGLRKKGRIRSFTDFFSKENIRETERRGGSSNIRFQYCISDLNGKAWPNQLPPTSPPGVAPASPASNDPSLPNPSARIHPSPSSPSRLNPSATPFSPSSSLGGLGTEDDPDWLLYTRSSSEAPSPMLMGLSSTSMPSYADVAQSKGKQPMVESISSRSKMLVAGKGSSSASPSSPSPHPSL
jgi:hypothetical protein